MQHGICINTLVPMRKTADHRSEMVSQILFGELYEVFEERKNWLYIRCDYDQYEGWISRNEFFALEPDQHAKLKAAPGTTVWQTLVHLKEIESGRSIHVVAGSTLYHCAGNLCSMPGKTFKVTGLKEKPAFPDVRTEIQEIARQYLSSPYLWGGRSPFGLDCSGFTQVVFKIAGKTIPRDASQQVTWGETIHFLNDALPGDLAFLQNEEGNVTHTGIILPDSKIIHSSGSVRIDQLDHQGIYNEDAHHYTHALRTVKRI